MANHDVQEAADKVVKERMEGLRKQAEAKVEVDPARNIKFYYNSAPTLLKQADTYYCEGNKERAYILFFRYAVFVTKLLSHPASKNDMTTRNELREKCTHAMNLIETDIAPKLKVEMRERAIKQISAERERDRLQKAAASEAAARQERERLDREHTKQLEQAKRPSLPAEPLAPLDHVPIAALQSKLTTPPASSLVSEHTPTVPLIYPSLQPMGPLPTYVPHSISPSAPLFGVADATGEHQPTPSRPPPLVPPKPNFMAMFDERLSSSMEPLPPIPPKPSAFQAPFSPVIPPKPSQLHYTDDGDITPPIPPKPAMFNQDLRDHHNFTDPALPVVPPKPDSINDFGIPEYVIEDERLRELIIPEDVIPAFLKIAHPNTERNKETCGILCGVLEHDVFTVTHLVIPQQDATSDSCTTKNEEMLLQYQDNNGLLTLGWIHTHPSQTCFMSSVDLHTHCTYQLMMPEAIAIVCAPKYTPSCGIFRLTDPPGLKYIANCRKTSFHPHEMGDNELYADCMGDGTIKLVQRFLTIKDLR